MLQLVVTIKGRNIWFKKPLAKGDKIILANGKVACVTIYSSAKVKFVTYSAGIVYNCFDLYLSVSSKVDIKDDLRYHTKVIHELFNPLTRE